MSEVEWREFEIGDLFNIFTGKDLILSKTNEGFVPVISHKEGDNGIVKFIERVKNRKLFDCQKTISLADRGTFKAYTQPSDYQIATRVKVLESLYENINEYSLKFICTTINKQKNSFSYGYNATNKLPKLKIMLPVRSDGRPNYEFMEQFIKNQENESLKKPVQFLKDDLLKLGYFQRVSLNNAAWEAYIIESIIDIYNGVRLKSADMDEGTRPFIGATEYNNGITNYVSNTNKSLDSNVLGINYNGSVCEGFYHQYNAVFSDDVKRLKFKNGINNEYTLHFLLTAVEKQRTKYQYGYKFNTTRMKNQKIMLPASPTGEPDYEFMENYIKGIKYESIMKAINFIENKNKNAK